MIRIISAALLILVALCPPAPAQQPQSLDQQTRTLLLGKTVKLRNFYIGRELKYDNDGKLVSGAQPGTWTLDCFLRVTDVKVSKNVLEIRAQRLAVTFDHFKKEMKNAIVPDYNTTILVQLARNPDLASVNHALSRIFLNDQEPLQTLVPHEWQWFLQNPFQTYKSENVKKETTWAEAAPTGKKVERPASSEPRGPDEVLPDGTYVFRVVSQATPIERVRPGFVTAPLAVFTPEPIYPDRARSLHAQGTTVLFAIVDASGSIIDLAVQRPLGLGLDEEAFRAVKLWKFEAAKKDGKPVPVLINVEVKFALR